MTQSAVHGRRRASVLASVVQVVVSGFVLFLQFRYLYDQLGIEQIGVWSLVLATTSVSRIGELGLSAGVIRFVAQALGRRDEARAAEVIQTVVVTLGVFMAAVLLAAYPAAVVVIRKVVPAEAVALAVGILPYALVSLWINVAASVFSGGLDGCMRIDLRCIAIASLHVVFLLFVFFLTPIYGLRGVAIAQVLQALGLLLTTWWLIRRELRTLPVVPFRWNRALLSEMIGYGLSFQAISVMSMLLDPVAKALLSKLGGLDALGFYEMANKLILQGRSVIVEAVRFLVPSIAALHPEDVHGARNIFVESYRVIFYVAVVFFGLLGTGLTAISLLWIGRYEYTFVLFAVVLSVGWFINTLVVPAYFSNLGLGQLRANVISHAIIGVVASVSGWTLGSAFGGLGVVVGTTLGLVSGSLFLTIGHFVSSDIDWRRFIVPAGTWQLIVLAAALVSVTNGYGTIDHSPGPVIVTALGCSALLFAAAWLHPLRAQLLDRLRVHAVPDTLA